MLTKDNKIVILWCLKLKSGQMQIKIWPEDPNGEIVSDLKKLVADKKQILWYLKKLKKYELYPKNNLFSSEVVKRIVNWPLYEIRIKNIRFLGDIIDEVFWIFTVEKKQRGKLPSSAFEKAKNIRNKFLKSKYENF